MNIEQVIRSIDDQISRLQQAKAILGGGGAGEGIATGRRRRHMSAAAKARIAAGQRKRWAKVKAAQKKK